MSHSKTIALVTLAVFAASAAAYVYPQVTQIPVTADDQAKGPPADTRVTMQTKLTQSQRVMEGLVRRDFKMVKHAAGVLKDISLTPPPSLAAAGDESDDAIYEHFRMEFARLAGKLELHAEREEPEATAYVQQNLTATCIACHEYIRDFD
jgi:hypothetical protein